MSAFKRKTLKEITLPLFTLFSQVTHCAMLCILLLLLEELATSPYWSSLKEGNLECSSLKLRLLGIFQSLIADDESETRLKLLGLTKKTFSDYEDCNHDDRPRSGKMYIVHCTRREARRRDTP